MKKYNISKNIFKHTMETKETLVTKTSDVPDSENFVTKGNDIANSKRLKRKVKAKVQKSIEKKRSQ